MTVGLPDPDNASPIAIGEAQNDGRYAVVYSFQPDYGETLRALPVAE